MQPALINHQKGAMAITIAFWLVVFIAFAATAFDVGHLMIVRNELQNGADAAALAGANCLDKTATATGNDCTIVKSPSLNWGVASVKASNSIGLNKSDNTSLIDGSVATGYWNVNGGSTLEPTSLTPLGACTVVAGLMTTPCHKPAVRVTLNRAAGSNGGPVQTFIQMMLGGEAVPISASAVAVLSSPSTVAPSTLIPQAINKCMFDLYWDSVTNSPKLADQTTLTYVDKSGQNPQVYTIPQIIGQPWRIRLGSSIHYGTCNSGQWTSFDQMAPSANNVNDLRTLINTGNQTPLSIGDDTWIRPGTTAALYDTLDARYPTPPGSSGWDVSVVVVDQPAGWDTNAKADIAAFAAFHIEDIVKAGGNPKFYIEGHFTGNLTSSGSTGIGPYYGVYTPPRLAQ